jgi:hypothetical protein
MSQYQIAHQPGKQDDPNDYGRAVVVLPATTGVLLPPACKVDDMLPVRTSIVPMAELIASYRRCPIGRSALEVPDLLADTQPLDDLPRELDPSTPRCIVIYLDLCGPRSLALHEEYPPDEHEEEPNNPLWHLIGDRFVYEQIIRSACAIASTRSRCWGIDYPTVMQIAKHLDAMAVALV